MNEQYQNINDSKTYTFSSCENCETPCCDGQRFFFIPLILEDFEEVYKNFAIVFAKIDNAWRMLMLLAHDNSSCAYFKEGKCSIYHERPPGCQLYPLTPFYDEVLIDTACPAISTNAEGDFFASQGNINSSFYHKRLENFNEKRLRSETYLQELREDDEDMDLVGVHHGIEVYAYGGSKNDTYLTMHKESLKFL